MPRLLPAVLLLVAGCAAPPDRPPPPALSPGQTVDEVAALQGNSLGLPALQFLAGDTVMAVYGADSKGRVIAWSPMMRTADLGLVFAGGRYLATLDFMTAVAFPECLLRPDGSLLLAARLHRLAAGEPDPLRQPVTSGDQTRPRSAVDCPRAGRVVPAADPSMPSPVIEAAKEAGSVSALVVLAPAILTGAVAHTVIAGPRDREALEAQQSLVPGMDQDQVLSQLGAPATAFDERVSGTRVLRFPRSVVPDLWVGLRDGGVVWTSATWGATVLAEWAALVGSDVRSDTAPDPGRTGRGQR